MAKKEENDFWMFNNDSPFGLASEAISKATRLHEKALRPSEGTDLATQASLLYQQGIALFLSQIAIQLKPSQFRAEIPSVRIDHQLSLDDFGPDFLQALKEAILKEGKNKPSKPRF